MEARGLASCHLGELQLTELTYQQGDSEWAPGCRVKRPGHVTPGVREGPCNLGVPL